MINPLHSLAFSIQANPGVYAVLVGSGVSRSAQIPTGWEITIDFVRKLAEVAGENCGIWSGWQSTTAAAQFWRPMPLWPFCIRHIWMRSSIRSAPASLGSDLHKTTR